MDGSPEENDSILALDIGTSSVRAIAYNANGNEVGEDVRVTYSMDTTPDGGIEIDAERLIRAVMEVLDGFCSLNSRLAGLTGVAITTFWHNTLGVDDDGNAVTPLISWADTRPASVIPALRDRLDETGVHDRTGCVLHPSYLPAKLLWFAEERETEFKAARHWMSIGEYLILRLFGKTVCSVSMASGTGLLNAHNCQWDSETLDALPVRQDQLSEITDFDAPYAGLQHQYEKRWPSLSGIPWWPAVGDGACSNIGSGCVGPDRAALMVGTSGAMRVMWSASEFEIPEGLWCYRADARRILMGGALSNGGNVYGWMRDTLQLDSEQAIEKALADTLPVAHGLTVLPFWAGERSPGWHASARATITGLTLHSTPMDILRAGLEATAYCFASIHERLGTVNDEGHEIIASGAGLLQSPAWMQMMADVLGQPVIASAVPEASSRGAALLVMEAMGIISDLSQAPVPTAETYQPDTTRHGRYREAMNHQQTLYDELIK